LGPAPLRHWKTLTKILLLPYSPRIAKEDMTDYNDGKENEGETMMAQSVLTAEDRKAIAFHQKKYAKYYKPGILQVDHHLRLVESITQYARQASIPEYFIYQTKLSDYCGEHEINYVRRLQFWPDEGIAGMVYVGSVPGMEDRMMAIGGAVTRNMIGAKMLTLQELIVLLKNDDPPEETVVLIPNFFLDEGSGGGIPGWQIAMIVGWLMSRFSGDKQTILHVSNMAACAAKYGKVLTNHISTHYVVTE